MQRLRSIGVVVFVVCLASRSILTRAEDKPASRNELGGFPLLGGDSDLGVGVGGFVSLARFDPGYAPYRYRFELAGAITFKPSRDGLEVPYQDIYLALTMPQLISKRLQLELHDSYTHETTLAYSGIGNASPPPASSAPHDFEYGLVHPTWLLRLRLKLIDHGYLQLGDILSYDRPQVRANSLLAEDATLPSLHAFFGTTAAHSTCQAQSRSAFSMATFVADEAFALLQGHSRPGLASASRGGRLSARSAADCGTRMTHGYESGGCTL